jgi:uncharacterized protein YecE (DUF72 family)
MGADRTLTTTHDADLTLLRKMLAKQPQSGYLMFNNFSSKADALRFRELSQLRACE